MDFLYPILLFSAFFVVIFIVFKINIYRTKAAVKNYGAPVEPDFIKKIRNASFLDRSALASEMTCKVSRDGRFLYELNIKTKDGDWCIQMELYGHQYMGWAYEFTHNGASILNESDYFRADVIHLIEIKEKRLD